MSTLTTGDNKFGPARWYVSNTLVDGCTHTTIASAITSASSGDDIFIKPNTYTENLTLKAGVNLIAWEGDEQGNVIIIGKMTFTAAGTVNLSNLQLQTNSDFCLAVTGSAASIVNLINCNLNATNNTAISYTSSSASSQINIFDCIGNLGTTGIAYFSGTSPGLLMIDSSNFSNTGSSLTASTMSAGIISIQWSLFGGAITNSGTNSVELYSTSINMGPLNTTALTLGGSGANGVDYCKLSSGTASCISIGGAATVDYTIVSSSNANAITGAGTLNQGLIIFTGSSSTINTNTVVNLISSPLKTSAITDTGITAYAVVTGGTSSTAPLQNVSGVGTAGQVLTSAGAGALPTWSASAPVSVWTDQSGAFAAVSGHGYFLSAASTPTLPAAPNEGDTVMFVNDAAATTTVTGNAGQKIRIGGALSAAAGTAASTTRGDSLVLTYRSTGTTWFSVGAPEGTWAVT
jgi:hypothetical protein